MKTDSEQLLAGFAILKKIFNPKIKSQNQIPEEKERLRFCQDCLFRYCKEEVFTNKSDFVYPIIMALPYFAKLACTCANVIFCFQNSLNFYVSCQCLLKFQIYVICFTMYFHKKLMIYSKITT